MQSTDLLPNGMIMRDFVLGWDLNNGWGFESEDDALNTQDPEKYDFGKYFKIAGRVYRLCNLLKAPDYLPGPVFVEVEDE